MSSEDGEMWKAFKKMKQGQRAQRRETAPESLHTAGIFFTEHNGGAHLIVEGPECFIDYWPGTNKWRIRNDPPNKYRFGLTALIKHIKGDT